MTALKFWRIIDGIEASVSSDKSASLQTFASIAATA
jgi:hypothetical protein